MGWYQDNPGGEWLKGKWKYAVETGHRTGSITATLGTRGPCQVSLKEAIKWKGAVGEEAYRDSDDRYKHMMANFDPELVDMVMIWIVYGGQVLIGEGNHRIQVCHDQGLDWIHADVRYFIGGEQFPGIMKPRTALKNEIIRPGKGVE